MKKLTTPLKTSWRNFVTSDTKSASSTSECNSHDANSTETQSMDNNESFKVNPNRFDNQASSSGGFKSPPGLSNSSPQALKAFEKFKSKQKIHSDEIEDLYDAGSTKDIDNDIIDDFKTAVHYSRINLKPARSNGLDLKSLKNRRLGVELSRIISKIAEDYSGANTEGDDFWDGNRLATRKISKESILKCKMSKEKQNVIIMLDSSPSCDQQARFYSVIAAEASKFGDVELYDAPNARIVHKYNTKTGSFEKFLTKQDVMNNVHEWSLINNRTIIFFGDNDGVHILGNNSNNNKIYYISTEAEYRVRKYLPKHLYKNVMVLPNVRTIKDFMKVCKKLR